MDLEIPGILLQKDVKIKPCSRHGENITCFTYYFKKMQPVNFAVNLTRANKRKRQNSGSMLQQILVASIEIKLSILDNVSFLFFVFTITKAYTKISAIVFLFLFFL